MLKDLVDIFETGLALSRNEIFLGYRPLVSSKPVKYADHYVWETYEQIDIKRRAVGSALYTWFKDGTLGGGELETVGIWSKNRPGMSSYKLVFLWIAEALHAEWQVVDLAVHAYQKVSVSLYDTLGKDSVGELET